MKKRFLIFILALVMTLIFVPGIASAANTTEFAGGDGTLTEPYLISNKTQLNNVRNYLDSHFKLTCDIVFTDADFAWGGDFYNNGEGWEPIGTSTISPFYGTFDGNGFAIKNLYVHISRNSESVYAGLFGYNEGNIKNLGIVDGNISATTSSSYNTFLYAGGIAGYNTGNISECYNTGTVSATASSSSLNSASAYAGGIVGRHYSSTIERCYNTGTVSATASSSFSHAARAYGGGIAGENYQTITNCYNAGAVSASTSYQADVGGIVGYNYKTISNCYNTGYVSAAVYSSSSHSNTFIGGIAGYNTGNISECYNTGRVSVVSGDYDYGGGIAGHNSGTINYCYYLNTTSSGVSSGTDGATKCTSEQMQTQSTFVGFDFAKIWDINADSQYKYPTMHIVHTYETTILKATASTDGRTDRMCTVCGVGVSTTIHYAKIFTLPTTSYPYDGLEKTPIVTVTDSAGNLLVWNTDYIVTYAGGRKNLGTYSVTVEGIGNYDFTKTLLFTINPADISSCSVNLSATNYTYNGSVKTPSVTVKNAFGTTLTKDTDYTVTYASGRKNAGTYNVKVTMKGNYTGTKTLSFKINPVNASNCAASLSTTSYTYNGGVKTPTVTVKSPGGSTLTNGTSYTVTYASGRKNAGTYTVKVTMKGNYIGTKTLSFKINPIQASNYPMKLSSTSYTYNGKLKTPTVTVTTPSGSKLTNGTSYTVSYASGRVNVGTYTVKVTMKGNYTGTKTLSFKINPIKASNCSMKLSTTAYTYDGKAKAPSVKIVSPTGSTLTKGTSYTVTYASGRVNIGTYTVKVTMKGNYTGTRTLSFKINPAKASNCSMSLSTVNYPYTGGVKAPTVTVKSPTGSKLTKGTSYTVSYASGRKNVGTYTVKVTMKGNYTGTKTLTFYVKPTTKTSASLLLGKTLNIGAKSNKTITYTSSNSSIAKVSSAGKITAVKTGTATITVKSGTVSQAIKVTVKAPYVTVSGTSSMLIGKSVTLKATTNTSATVKWSTGNSSIATVSSSGKVTGKKAGTTTIYAKITYLGKTYTGKYTVTVKPPYLAKTSAIIDRGDTCQISMVGGSGTAIYSSSNTSIASVSSNGVVRGLAAGTATITVKRNGYSYKFTVKVVAEEPVFTIWMTKECNYGDDRTVALSIKNLGTKTLTLTPNADIMNIGYSSLSEDMYLAYFNGVLDPAYVNIAPEEEIMVLYATVDGSTCWYDKETYLTFSFTYEGTSYIATVSSADNYI